MTSRPLLSRRQNASSGADTAPVEGVMQILAHSARRRIAMFATVFSGAFGVGFALSVIMPPLLNKNGHSDWVLTTLTGFLTATSLVLASMARSSRISPARLVDLGLIYVVLGCLSMSGAEVLLGPALGEARSGVSGICVWLVMFPLIIPSTPRKALLTALSGATMLPLSYLIGVLLGNPTLPGTALVDWFFPLYFCAGLSYAAARSVYSWGTSLAESERKMAELGSYQLLDRIATGGMGVVYRARHRFLPRDAAVKLIDAKRLSSASGEESGSMLASLFEREAQAIALLESPHTVAVYDYGMSDRGELYFAMEMLRGTDLQRLVELKGPLGSARVNYLLQQVCDSLAEAHHKGLIHRDIKPANVFTGVVALRHDFVKVLDFGLASVVSAAQEEHQGGAVIGTPGYIAPEALTGGTVDHRCDIYALGCLSFFLLSGRTVFGDGGGENMVSHIRQIAPSLIELVPDVDPDLATLVGDCLAKKPTQRPQSALELRSRLKGCQSAGVWTTGAARSWWTEHGADFDTQAAIASNSDESEEHTETLETYR